MHICFNSLILFPYSQIFESQHGFIKTMTIFEIGVLTGTLGFAYFYPYLGLIGASHGVYALIGACLANIIINYDILSSFLFRQSLIILTTQFVAELISYFFFYNNNVAYSAHLAGFGLGLLLGLFFVNNKLFGYIITWKSIISYLGLLSISSILIYFSYNFATNYPPKINHYLGYGSHESQSCCLSLFELMKEGYSFDYITNKYYCPGQSYSLVPR